MNSEQRAAALRLADAMESAAGCKLDLDCAALLRALAAEPEPEYEVLDSVGPLETRSQWSHLGIWLRPGDRIVLVREPALKEGVSMHGKQSEPVPVGWLDGPHGTYRPNHLWRLDPLPPQSIAWSIPLFHHIPPWREPLTPMDAFEDAIRRVGVVAACEWFGHAPESEFTKETARVLDERRHGIGGKP